jgi:ABC-type transport system involved in cytochrome bd biosynthesis fused ATPase/permease subunit
LSENALEIIDGNFYWDYKISKEDSATNKKAAAKKKNADEKKAKKEKRRLSKLSKLSKNGKGKNTNRQTASLSLLTVNPTSEHTLQDSLIDSVALEEGHANQKDLKEKPTSQNQFKFEDLNFRARKGELTMIIGKIGSGKSSLLMALLGEMRVSNFMKTKICVNTTIAYSSQTPWLLNGTVKENILLNKEFNKE